MNVLSLFDGKSSGFTALELAGMPVTSYYSSEVDKYAIQVSDAIHPNQTRLGDVTKWKEWDIDWASVDLLIAGSPCQGFSFAGKQLAFDDPRSKLFFVFVDILNHIKAVNPGVKFLLENVKMKKEYMAVIDEMVGEESILINSALISAQNRQRLYWSNIPIDQPEDKGIVLADIIEQDGIGHIKNHGHWSERGEKSMCIDANYHKGVDNHGQRTMILQRPRGNNAGGIKAINGKTPTLSANSWEHNNHLLTIPNETLDDSGKAYALTASYSAGMMASNSVERKQRSLIPIEESEEKTNQTHKGIKYRKLTPRECFRLQTTPEHYIDKILNCGVSNTQLYKIAGNGWTDEVIAHIFSELTV